MKTLKNLTVPQDTNRAKWPFGTIKNETDTEPGTPVVREIFGDILTNIYKILQDAGISPNGNEDSEEAGYQLLQALKKFANELNDVEQVVSLAGNTWSVNINIDNLPDKYVLFCRMADEHQSGIDYVFSGTGNETYPLTSPTGFNASDEVILIIDQAEVRVYSLTGKSKNVGSGVFPVFGNPVAFNNTDKIYYESSGNLLTDDPSTYDLQQRLRVATGNSILYVNEILILKGHVLCVVFDTAAVTYKLFQFSLTDLENPVEVNIADIPVGSDNAPYVYTDGEYIYITNAGGTTANDFELKKFAYDPATPSLTFSQSIALDEDFQKSTNVVVREGYFVSFVEGVLRKYDLSTGAGTLIGQFNTLLGIIFNYKGEVYYSNGEVAKEWSV